MSKEKVTCRECEKTWNYMSEHRVAIEEVGMCVMCWGGKRENRVYDEDGNYKFKIEG